MWLEPCSDPMDIQPHVNAPLPVNEPPPVAEGSPCPTCKRRVPYKKKPSSPKTQVVSVRVPIDDAEVFAEILEAAALYSGLHSKPHWKFWTLHRGLALILQEPGEEEAPVDRCIVCGALGAHSHHRKLRSQGGGNEPENLVRLCSTCHDSVHRNPAASMRSGLIVRSTDDPKTALCRPAYFLELLAE